MIRISTNNVRDVKVCSMVSLRFRDLQFNWWLDEEIGNEIDFHLHPPFLKAML